VAHGDEAPVVLQNLKLADDMGLFLQKTNIIRDYLEDLVEGRAFWPREIWSQYGSKLADFAEGVAAAAHAGACRRANASAISCYSRWLARALRIPRS